MRRAIVLLLIGACASNPGTGGDSGAGGNPGTGGNPLDGGSMSDVGGDLPDASVDATTACILHGSAVGLYLDGQSAGQVIPADQARARIRLVSPYTTWLRLYSSLGGHAEAACFAKNEFGRKIALTAWLGRDAAANEREILALIAAANMGCVDIAIVGSETLLRQDQTPAALIALLRRVKAAVPTAVQVATGDVYDRLTAEVIAAEDVVLAHVYPFWENVPARYALASLHARYVETKARAAGKTVIVAETGWPSAGRADATPENAATYLVQFTSWARAGGVGYFYFSAFDEAWKTNEGAVGPHWGYLTSGGAEKPGADRTLERCETTDDVWSGTALVGGTGAPGIVLTSVPPLGSSLPLEGRVEHVRPSDHRIAVYIFVGGGWWTKPTTQTPASPIWPDGTFQIPVATGGSDAQATEIRSYLIPAGMAPPLLTGAATLPATLAPYPSAQASR